jgi:hypothetical protein
LQFVLIAERFGLKTVLLTVISRSKFGRARTLKYYRKPLLYGAKGSKMKGEVKDCFPFASVIGSLVARAHFSGWV